MLYFFHVIRLGVFELSDVKNSNALLCSSSDFTNVSLPNGVEPPRNSILGLVLDNPNALHHLVCEGDAAGVRLALGNFYCLHMQL
jgi:hypothetical protein